MKILILGGGQDAFILSYLFHKKFNVRTSLSVRDLTINNSVNNWADIYPCGSFIDNIDNLFNLILNIKPDFVINTAALSSSKDCNKSPDIVYKINGEFPIKLIKFLSINKINLVHFGSILEREYRPECTYTNSKLLVSNFLNEYNSNAIVKNLLLPNHESPLRDKRFFVREIISIFQPVIKASSNSKLKFNLLDGTTSRYWSWAPSLLGEIVEMVYRNDFHNNFYPFTTKLSLIEFIATVANLFGISNLSINCKKTGNHNLENITLPKIDKYAESWIKELFITEYNSRFEMDLWCKEFK